MFLLLSLQLSVRTPGKLKSLPDNGGSRTRNLWFASPVLYQLSYQVKSVSVRDISELILVPSPVSVCLSLIFLKI